MESVTWGKVAHWLSVKILAVKIRPCRRLNLRSMAPVLDPTSPESRLTFIGVPNEYAVWLRMNRFYTNICGLNTTATAINTVGILWDQQMSRVATKGLMLSPSVQAAYAKCIELMIAMRVEFPDARFLIVTKSHARKEIRRSLSEGGASLLAQKYASSELVDVIRQVCAGKRNIRPPSQHKYRNTTATSYLAIAR